MCSLYLKYSIKPPLSLLSLPPPLFRGRKSKNLPLRLLSPPPLSKRSSWNSGKLVRLFLPNRSSAGLTRVVVLGVDLYAIKYLRMSSFHCLPSACALPNLFKRDQFFLSISPFVWGHKGMVLLCSIPHSSKYLSNILETN